MKLNEFEHMTRQMTRAAPALADLADQLWQTLNAAGVSTAPALEIRRLAAWATDAASDLRRRSLLAHDLDREHIAMKMCTPDGTYLTLPDRYTDQVAHIEGARAADALRRAAAGDRTAWDELNRIRPEDVTPSFAQSLMASLGPTNLLAIPIALAKPLSGEMNLEPADGSLHIVSDSRLNADAKKARTILTFLARSLATTTDPQSKAYLGDHFLDQLRDAGRSHFPPEAPPTSRTDGYQSLATILASSGPSKFSPAFFRVVGNDMIAYDKTQRKNTSEIVTDLSGHFHLGNALDPGATKVVRDQAGLISRHGSYPQRELLSPLLEAAAHSGRDAAQTLLTGWHGPFAPKDESLNKTSNLYYLIHDLRPDWGKTDHAKALAATLQTAASGQDPASTAIALQAAKALADNARTYFKPDTAQKKMTVDKDSADDLSALRPAMAQILSNHIDRLHSIYRYLHYTTTPDTSGLENGDLDYVLLDVCRDANAYDTLLKAEIVHARLAVDAAIARPGDVTRNLEDALPSEGWMFGRLLEARTRTVQAETDRLEESNAQLREHVNQLVGLIPVASLYGRAAQAAPAAGAIADQATPKLLGALETWITQRLAEHPDPTILAPKSNTEATQRLFSQMIASSMVQHRKFPLADARGEPFGTGDGHSVLRAPESLGHVELQRFMEWARNRAGFDHFEEISRSTLEQGRSEVAGHFGNDLDAHLPSS
ncbi:hypothetical protein [Actinomadura rupiterrae]|uniref:hypothetical protein n=1 Tax=Actinomadura rupiterrae TaxID=559627 RepID=UPI0020A2EFC5|nr:hypothetical protein [Actinomadura rupiterrae]MCP2335445.1 hypothetical protein [Actinomadura rupiterrae]